MGIVEYWQGKPVSVFLTIYRQENGGCIPVGRKKKRCGILILKLVSLSGVGGYALTSILSLRIAVITGV